MIADDEERLPRLLRAAIPPMAVSDPGRDLWPHVLHRIQERPRFSTADKALLALMLIVSPFFPRAVLFLVYSL